MLTLTAALGVLLLQAPAAPPANAGDPWKRTASELQKGIQDAHPATYMILATKLFEAGRKDDAVFWLYAGQLRYRFLLAAHPEADPSGDKALFASLHEVVGRPINEYAWGDLPALRATLNRVLDWDKAERNGFTSVTTYAQQWNTTRAGLQTLIAYTTDHAEEIRQQRKARAREPQMSAR